MIVYLRAVYSALFNLFVMEIFISIMNFLYDIIVGSPDLNYAVIAPLVGSALVSGAAGLIGSIFGHSSNNSTNKTNLRIARENREFYSEPAQMARMREAGINPYMAMSQVGGGVQQAAQMQPDTQTGQILANTGETIGQAIFQQEQVKQMQEQNELIKQQTEAQRLQNFFTTATNLDRIQAFRSNSRVQGMQAYLFEHTLPNLLKQSDLDTSIREYEQGVAANHLRVSAINALIAENFGVKREKLNYDVTYNILAQGRIKIGNLLYEGQLTKAKIVDVAAEIAKKLEETYDIRHTRPYRERNLQSSTNLNNEQATDISVTRPFRLTNLTWQTENLKSDVSSKDTSTNLTNRITEYLVEEARERAEHLGLQNDTYWQDNFFQNLGSLSGSAGNFMKGFGFDKVKR